MSTALAKATRLLAAGRRAEAIDWLDQHRVDPGCAVRLREIHLGEHDNLRGRDVARQLAVAPDAEGRVSRSVLALMDRDLDTAVRECEAALALSPGLATAHNHLARALHNSGQTLQAISALRLAVELDPEYAEAWYNLGLVQRASGALAEAIRAYRRALELAPGYRAAELNLGISLLLTDQLDEALFCLQSVLSRHPDDAEALVNAGLALHTLGRFREAHEHLKRAVDIQPDDSVAWTYLGVLLHEIHDHEAALEALRQAVALDPGDVEAWVEMASIHEQASDLGQARSALENARRVGVGHPALVLEWARLQAREGEHAAALATLRTLHPDGLPPRLAQQVQFELGKQLDRSGAWDAAVAAFAQGNRLLARSVRRRSIDPDGFGRECRELRQWLEAGAPGARPAADDPTQDTGADLIFLVGFPRSGTTLLDTMLDAHPDIASIEEQATLEVVIDELRSLPRRYPGSLAGIDARQLEELRRRYREQCRWFLGDARPRWVVDKLPTRFMHAGLILRLFPDARLLFALRHPCDVVLSNFMQAYAESELYIHFDTLADCADTYDQAMGLWLLIEQTLQPPLSYCRYEDLVADPEAEVTRVCRDLGLEPVAAMFDATQRMAARARVRTASYQQVSEPVYERSVGRWRHYEPHLRPHLRRLQPYIEKFGYQDHGQPD